ncbi:hypothetical protein EGW08_000798 [Elysia chlorotica]|uniref:Uncharacterized protein n=1 Tax=Elysia chlorotica TaxID=188477 RepID=A0A3S1AGK9_ELYCH|nr:hypothetical protein EGW08_000798 [Elysia chlorotica]
MESWRDAYNWERPTPSRGVDCKVFVFPLINYGLFWQGRDRAYARTSVSANVTCQEQDYPIRDRTNIDTDYNPCAEMGRFSLVFKRHQISFITDGSQDKRLTMLQHRDNRGIPGRLSQMLILYQHKPNHESKQISNLAELSQKGGKDGSKSLVHNTYFSFGGISVRDGLVWHCMAECGIYRFLLIATRGGIPACHLTILAHGEPGETTKGGEAENPACSTSVYCVYFAMHE